MTLLFRPLRSAVLQFFGKLSYSWYLWHWPVLVFALAVFPGLSAWGRALCVTGSLALAAATTRLIENPIRFNRYLGLRPVMSMGLGLVLTVLGRNLIAGVAPGQPCRGHPADVPRDPGRG